MMAPSKAQGQAPASAPAPAPAPAPARAPTAATPANSNAFAVKKSSAAPNNVRKRVEPAIPLTFLRRPKATAASSPLPASPSPLRNHNKNTPPSPKQAHLDKSAARPQSDPVAPNTNGHKVETEASFSPPKSEQGDAGLDTVQVDDISAPPSDAIDPQLHDTPTQSQVGGETTPPGMHSSSNIDTSNYFLISQYQTLLPPRRLRSPNLLCLLLPSCRHQVSTPPVPPATATFEPQFLTPSDCHHTLSTRLVCTSRTSAMAA